MGRSGDNNVATLPDPMAPPARSDDRGVRNLEEMRRAMAEAQGQRLADENRDPYGRVMEQNRDPYDDRPYRYDNAPSVPRRYYGPPPRYEYLPPPMTRWDAPPRYYGPPPASDDRGSYYPDLPSDNRSFPHDPR
jgi:hypothetical protein